MLLKDCPVSVALRVIGGKWKPLLLTELKSGTLRYGELRRRIPEASHKVLTEQLRQLEASGIIEKSFTGGATPRSDYQLTPYGRTLRPILRLLSEWGKTHRRQQR